MDIAITRQAHDAIARATRTGHAERAEHGGSLLAFEDAGGTLLAYALPTGPEASQGGSHLLTDATFQNDAIDRARARYPGIEYVGDWHVHPMWLPSLSSTDLTTARRMLVDELPGRDHLVLGLGTMQTGAAPVVLGFVVTEDGARWVRAEAAELRIVEDDSVEVISRIGEDRLAPLSAVLASAAPRDTSEATVAHASATRILEELEEIRTEHTAQVIEWATADGQLAAIVRKGTHELIVVFPPEYPLGAPQVLVGGLGSGPSAMVPLRYGWSSLHRLVHVVGDGLAPAAPPPPSAPLDPIERAALGLARRAAMKLSRVLGPFAPSSQRRPE